MSRKGRIRRRGRPGKSLHGRAAALALHYQDRLEVLLRFGGTCVYCGQIGGEVTIDHAFPKSRGGPTIPENFLSACRDCNERKGDKSAEEFAPSCPADAPIHKILAERRRQQRRGWA